MPNRSRNPPGACSQRNIQPHLIVGDPWDERAVLSLVQLHQPVARHRLQRPRQVRLTPSRDFRELG